MSQTAKSVCTSSQTRLLREICTGEEKRGRDRLRMSGDKEVFYLQSLDMKQCVPMERKSEGCRDCFRDLLRGFRHREGVASALG